MKAIEKDLLAIEEKFWSGDESYYRKHADSACLVAFDKMAGLMSNPDLAATAKDGNRWKKLDIEMKGVVRPCDEVAILTYEANAEREQQFMQNLNDMITKITGLIQDIQQSNNESAKRAASV